MEGATAREERIVTVEEGAATGEGGVVTRDGAHLVGLEAHPKDTRGVPEGRKVTVRPSWDRKTYDDWCSDYIRKFPVEERRKTGGQRVSVSLRKDCFSLSKGNPPLEE
ncbi:hypothetical protein WISP_59215 [Willisornis vidua]|uniref:Uncharacterized protein n=1 Tax=Willisornis vidua TaxID=1566151 RepID=A0ABQ9DG76_9PASS|nr:hypothetical protein WISP_59215 [Willisornis vidua]